MLKKIKQDHFKQKNLEKLMGNFPMNHSFQVLKQKVILKFIISYVAFDLIAAFTKGAGVKCFVHPLTHNRGPGKIADTQKYLPNKSWMSQRNVISDFYETLNIVTKFQGRLHFN